MEVLYIDEGIVWNKMQQFGIVWNKMEEYAIRWNKYGKRMDDDG